MEYVHTKRNKMKAEKPILMSTPMVKAILEGRKNQTRRVVKENLPSPLGKWSFKVWEGSPFKDHSTDSGVPDLPYTYIVDDSGRSINIKRPYGKPGDRLWVRETWQKVLVDGGGFGYTYKANYHPFDRAKRTLAISGRRCVEQLGRLNHRGLWVKTFLASLVGMEDWYSMKCRLTWKLKGTKYSRLYCQLAVSELPTDETGFGLLPTIQTQGLKVCNNGKTEFMNLKLLPTPDCSDRRGPGSKQQGLSNVMKELLPTPATRDYKGTNSQEHFNKTGQRHMTQLPNALKFQHGISGQLNPLFVAEMMGFPPDWTLLPFQSGETNQ